MVAAPAVLIHTFGIGMCCTGSVGCFHPQPTCRGVSTAPSSPSLNLAPVPVAGHLVHFHSTLGAHVGYDLTAAVSLPRALELPCSAPDLPSFALSAVPYAVLEFPPIKWE